MYDYSLMLLPKLTNSWVWYLWLDLRQGPPISLASGLLDRPWVWRISVTLTNCTYVVSPTELHRHAQE